MAENGATPDEKEKLDPEAQVVFGDNELDDSKAKFINGGKTMDGTTVAVEVSSSEESSFTGLSKEELKKYADDPFWVRLRWILFILFWVGWLAMLVSAIVIIVLAPRCPTRPDLKWYHTDSAYNVYAKSFLDGEMDKDGKQDGIGDLKGVEMKQGYIEGLGAKTIWLSSIFKTDDTDGGIVDYKELDEKFGTIDTFKAFMKKMLKKGVHVIVDLIPNQTSKNHIWFQSSRKNESAFRDYYVWADADNGWVSANGGSMWTLDDMRKQYYLHQRATDNPDLNWHSEALREEFKDIMNFWVGVGVSGFHIVDAEYLTENASFPAANDNESQTRNFADNAEVIDFLRGVVDGMDNKPGREKLLMATVKARDLDTLNMYYGGEEKRGVHMVSVVLDQLDSSKTSADLKLMLEPYINISTNNWLGWRLGSDSVPRIASRMGRESMTVAHALQILLTGTPQFYYGDEIGMGNGASNNGNDMYRSPMQWNKETNAGFTSGNPWLPINSDYMVVNVASLTAQLSSDKMVPSFKRLMELRKKESMQFGKTMVCTEGDLLMISRRAEGFPSFLFVMNLGSADTSHSFKGDECAGGKETATVVFHSHEPNHKDTPINFQEYVSIKAGEVLALEFDP